VPLNAADEWLLEEAGQPSRRYLAMGLLLNLCRAHEMPQSMPAMALGVIDHIWTVA
jgi:hypothetical protein